MKTRACCLLLALLLLAGCSGQAAAPAQSGEDYQSGVSAGYEQGYAQGLEAGYAEGYEAGLAEAQAATQADEEPFGEAAAPDTVLAAAPELELEPADGGVIVYVTKSGTKYHREGCSYLSDSKTALTLAEAKEKGYAPCSRCDPPS